MKLTDEQVSFFRENGYLVAEKMVTSDDLAPVIAEYEAFIDKRAHELKAEGKITDLCENEGFRTRMARLYAQSLEIAKGMDIMEMRGRAMFNFLRNDNLLDAVESLVGPEITCNPIQHIRAKVPDSLSKSGFYNVPWHQDIGVTLEEATNSDIITCWMAVVDATVENGCMEVLPGVWKNGELGHHSGEGGTTIVPDELPEVQAVPVPVGAGGFVFMHRSTPHRSTPNFSDGVRWSIDLRYQPTGQPTGRPLHPEFVARSRSNPASVFTDYEAWSRNWVTALENSKGAKMHRVK